MLVALDVCFRNADALPVLRGRSTRPLFVSSVGIEVSHAARCIVTMHGPYRIPTLLKKAHDLACHAARDLRRST
jgi:deoxyribonuclease V